MRTSTHSGLRSSPLRRRKALAQIGRVGHSLLPLKALFRAVVLERDGHRCRKCGNGKRPGRGGGLQAAHIKPVGTYPHMRFMVANALTLCATPCHLYWWHKDTTAAAAWARLQLGDTLMDKLDLCARTRGGRLDKEATRLYLERELRAYKELARCS